MAKAAVVYIGHATYVVSPEDAAALLAIALRAIPVTYRSEGGKHWMTQTGGGPLLLQQIMIEDYEPLALPEKEAPF